MIIQHNNTSNIKYYSIYSLKFAPKQQGQFEVDPKEWTKQGWIKYTYKPKATVFVSGKIGVQQVAG